MYEKALEMNHKSSFFLFVVLAVCLVAISVFVIIFGLFLNNSDSTEYDNQNKGLGAIVSNGLECPGIGENIFRKGFNCC